MPIEFTQTQQLTGSSDNSLFRLTMAYDGSGRRISKTRWVKKLGSQEWEKELVTHYTGIGTEVREDFSKNQTKVVVNMPNGLGRYGIEDAEKPDFGGRTGDQLAGYIPNVKFEWYLKNHLGSTMLVYGTQANAAGGVLENKLEPLAAYDYRAFGEMIELTPPSTGKVTENFTGKEHDDEIALDYFGARYLDPMLGMWISVDPARQFASPYLYAGNGVNPMNVVDPDGNTTLKLNEDNTVAGKYDDGNLNMVSVFKADGSLFGEFNAPPAGSYFNIENLIGQKFDPNMQQNVDELLDNAYNIWPVDFPFWYSGFSFDFKDAYYKGAENTVGSLDGTIMTVRDVGNAIWGGWTRHMYPFCTRSCMETISNIIAGGKEDAPSAVMQIWGYDNYKP